MSLVQPLPPGPLDIVGDIHGEYAALQDLLRHLGYDAQGTHPQGRTLVFVGDFCDRGPDSPAVLALAQRLVEAGPAVAVLGNHEMNLLNSDAKDGSGWFFDERHERDQADYAPFARPDAAARQAIVQWLSGLPIALERDDLRVVHAVWLDAPIAAARQVPLGDGRPTRAGNARRWSMARAPAWPSAWRPSCAPARRGWRTSRAARLSCTPTRKTRPTSRCSIRSRC